MSDARTRVCDEILAIMASYRKPAVYVYGVEPPGGLGHAGGVWKLFRRWEEMLKAKPETEMLQP